MALQEPFTIDSFYKFAEQGKLMATRCEKCGELVFPPRSLCTKCYSDKLSWVQLKGTGTLLTYTIIHVAPPEFQKEAPYAVGVVRLDEGPRFIAMGRYKDPDELKIGVKVVVEFEKLKRTAWPFRPRPVFKVIA